MVIQIKYEKDFKQKAFQWAASFDVCSCLDSGNFKDQYSKFDALIAVGVKDSITAGEGNAFDSLATFRNIHPGWITGFFSYDLKNETENLSSANADHLYFPDLYFFVPKHIIIIQNNQIEIISENPEFVYEGIEKQIAGPIAKPSAADITQRFTRTDYIDTVTQIKEHISRGDIYVTNFCQEFFAEDAEIDPLSLFLKLNEISPNPFASFFKLHNKYILCASPERFLAKRGDKLISQPIKGTAKRGHNAIEDEQIKQQLRAHAKELQENVMVVDLVRNDLTRSAKPGSVKTEELFGIYTFNHLHQMISTVVCELDESVTPVEAAKNAFPMGSMTGAPKVSAMTLMEQFERSRRGVYSGALGYFSPDDDFDFNVVIRTLLYNSDNKYLSFHTGSAITYHADAEQEYEECLLKAQAILEVLDQSLSSRPSAR